MDKDKTNWYSTVETESVAKVLNLPKLAGQEKLHPFHPCFTANWPQTCHGEIQSSGPSNLEVQTPLLLKNKNTLLKAACGAQKNADY